MQDLKHHPSLGQIAQIYTVANTPTYLYKHLRKLPAIAEIGRTYTALDLVKLAENIERSGHRTLSDLARAYAALVALSFHDRVEAIGALRGVTFENLAWAARIIEISELLRIPTTKEEMTVPKLSLESSEGKDLGSVSSRADLKLSGDGK